ncbi:hypothetical protein K457DRAFT_138763 [Linnemannia elongata AG-77]|uniref:F-box domain-containing protein n=1 Tax=Linnemannia elongata AG-77 TaxID=1314771 RepID=A0A197JVI8_9FUNG|nr:hypothetical protein K457DRAFT_138763 [Linnemannia elongata AG-77]
MHETVYDIPELVALVASYLGTHDLLACVQVNRLWNSTLIPILWHTIDDSTPAWDTILRRCADPKTTDQSYLKPEAGLVKESDEGKDREWVRGVFWKYGRFVRKLTVQWPMVLEAVSLAAVAVADDGGGGGCKNLESLTLSISNQYAQGPIERDPSKPMYRPYRDYGDPEPEREIKEVNVSEPLFPEFVTKDDFIPAEPYFEMTAKGQQELLEYGWVLTQHYWHTILANRGLKRLDMVRVPEVLWGVRSYDVHGRLMGMLTELRELKKPYDGFEESADVWSTVEACPRIESIRIFTLGVLQFPDPLPNMAFSMNVRDLSLHKVTTVEGLLTLLRLLPNLTKLSLGCVGRVPGKESLWAKQSFPERTFPLPAIEAGVGRSLKVLYADLEDRDLVLSYLPNLTDYTVLGAYDEPLALALTKHCRKFETFRALLTPWFIDETQRLSQDPTNQFLVKNASLRVFHHIRHFVRVDEMLRQPWACLGLEWLTCRILDIDRLTDEEQATVDRVTLASADPGHPDAVLTEEETAAVEKFRRCQRQHHGVYDQLARLTRLKHLDLGYESRYPWAYRMGEYYEKDGEEYFFYEGAKTFDTLELSLESGLNRLAALENLELFGFECLNHRIGRRELDWMATSWPKLKTMYGLDKERLVDIEFDSERAALKEYFQQLRPDVVHDSLFENRCTI